MSTTLEVRGPATEAIPSLVAGLRQLFDSGRTGSLEWRLAQLDGLMGMLVTHEGELLDALRSDLGKPAFEGYLGDVSFTLGEATIVRAQLADWMIPEEVPTPPTHLPGRSEIRRDPLGVVLIIGPWNYPQQLVLLPLVGALAAGNAAVVKPSEIAPASSAVLAELLPRYVDGVVVVEGGVDVSTPLLDQRFDHIFYTGNGRVGRIVMEAAARHLTPVTLELGGKSPVIVAADADLDVTARRLAWGKWFNAGQTCVAPDYVLVDRRVEDALIERLTAAVRQFYGDDPHASPDFARIVTGAHLARLQGLLSSGRTVTGGEVDKHDRYLAPTILRDVAPDSPVMADEIFGPILPVLGVDSIDEAVAFVRARPHPLALYVFTSDETTASSVLSRTASGGACVNGTVTHITTPFLPFGGVGASGTGSYHGRATFETFSHRRSVLWRSTEVDPPEQYPPYPPLEVFKEAMAAAAAR